jgi:U3 small nucleolar RNA-associated protein 4
MELHRCRFVDYQPATINALSFTPPTVGATRLAVGRANGDIELWDPRHQYRIEKVIPGGHGLSIESLVWAHQSRVTDTYDTTADELVAEQQALLDQPPRLFSSSLNSYIMEWDAQTLTVKVSFRREHDCTPCADGLYEWTIEICGFQWWCCVVFGGEQ